MFSASALFVRDFRHFLERASVLCAFAGLELPAGLFRERSEFVFRLCHARTMTRTDSPRNSRARRSRASERLVTSRQFC